METATGGALIHWEERGQGPPLVLLHGNGEDMGVFEAQIPAFSQEYRVIAVDSRGHGKSVAGEKLHLHDMAEDLRFVLDAAGAERAHILGFSDGGNVALIFALKYPERVRSLVLSGANADPSGIRFRHYFPMQFAQLLMTAGTLFSETARRKKEFLDLMVLEPQLRKPDLNRIAAPALVTAGERDMIARYHTEYIKNNLQNAKLKIFPGGHFTPREHPEAYNAAVLEFLDEIVKGEK